MSGSFASGKFAWAICDICGLRCDYKDMRPQFRNMTRTSVLVCPDCVDVDRRPPRAIPGDPQALRHPRPENFTQSRRILHWRPTDHFRLQLKLGAATTFLMPPPRVSCPGMILGLGSVEVETNA